MRVREVIPFGKSDEEMEMSERGKRQNCGERDREAYKEKKFRGMFMPGYRLFVICILDLSKSR